MTDHNKGEPSSDTATPKKSGPCEAHRTWFCRVCTDPVVTALAARVKELEAECVVRAHQAKELDAVNDRLRVSWREDVAAERARVKRLEDAGRELLKHLDIVGAQGSAIDEFRAALSPTDAPAGG